MKTRLYKFKALIASVSMMAVLAMAGGCYNIGYMGHPQIESIGIAPVTNQTTGYNAAFEMRNLLCEQFMNDGTYKLKGLQDSDCLLYANIVGFDVSKSRDTSRDDDVTFRVIEWNITVTVEFSVIIPGRKEPVIPKREVSGSARFQSSGDMENSRRSGLRMACRSAAQTIVQYTTEAW
ncbi:MAG: LPS assembly lipoprotein LptE [Victivallaceae bacterium]|nr:LPS assembly lipoprotein LptE [Victivallaceae bacterium]